MFNHSFRITTGWIVPFLSTGLILASCMVENSPPLENVTIHIHDIQGCSHQSPYLGRTVEGVTGIVTKKNTNGFYMQTDQPDDKTCTSEAIFVFTRNYPDVRPGDLVKVSGQVDECMPGTNEDRNLTLTQLTDVRFQIMSHGNIMPDVVEIGGSGLFIPDLQIDNDGLNKFQPEEDGIDFYESLESMLVKVNSGIVVGSKNYYNEVVILPEEKIDTNLVSSQGALVQQALDPNPERIILNLNNENLEKVNLGAGLAESVTGIVDYAYGNFKVNVFGLADFVVSTPEITGISNNPDSLTIVAYNVENLSLYDDDTKFRGLAEDISKSMDNPDVLILHEIMDDSGVENDGVVTARKTLDRLVDQIAEFSGVHYSVIDNPPVNNRDGGIEGGNIRSCILYREDVGIRIADNVKQSVLKENPTRIGPDEWPFSVTRKPLVVLFEYKGNQFLIVALHLTSRGADSPLFGSIQPPERPEEEKRNRQALYINQFLADFHKRNPGIPIYVAGDLNDDPWSATLAILSNDLLVNLNELIPENERYSYILDGNAIQLDHILVTGDSEWNESFQILHLNTSLDHSEQISDHDAVIAEISVP